MLQHDLDAACKHLRLLIFPGTQVLHKQLQTALTPKQGPLITPSRVEEPAGPLTDGQSAVDTSSEAQRAVDAEPVTSSLPALQSRAEASTAAATMAAPCDVILPGQTQSETAPLPPLIAAATAVGAADDTPVTEYPSAADHGQFLYASSNAHSSNVSCSPYVAHEEHSAQGTLVQHPAC